MIDCRSRTTRPPLLHFAPARWPRVTALLALLVPLSMGLGSAPAAAADSDNAPPAGCALLWQVTAKLDATPRQLQVDMAFDAGPRSRTSLRLPSGWAAMVELEANPPAKAPKLQALADDPTLRLVEHASGERVRLRWTFTPSADPAQGGSAQLAADWFAVAGQAVLPVPDDIDARNPPSACVGLTGMTAPPRPDAADAAGPPRWATSHGSAEGPSAWFRVAPGVAPLRLRVQQALYAGGALQVASQTSDGQALTVARPAAPAWRFPIEALAQASAQATAAQRRFWGDTAPPGPLLVLLLPMPSIAQGTAWQQALALQAPVELALPGTGFDALITQALVRSWMPERFGPLVYSGRGDEAQRAWFSEGFADFYTHRLLLREGRWTPEDYASAINRKIERWLDASDRGASPAPGGAPNTRRASTATPPGAGGEWLALQWHAALRTKGEPGLDAVMRRLVVPAAQARREGPLSAPLATHRLVAGLRHVLDDAPLRDITRHIDQGEPYVFDAAALGPCFVGQRLRVPRWRLGFDPDSLVRRVLRGVEAGGPAEAAGLRNGMVLASHQVSPGDATQAVQLQVRTGDGGLTEIRYLPASEILRDLPRYQPVAQALQQPACQGWLGLGPETAQGSHRTAAASGAGKSGARASGKQGARSGAKGSNKHSAKGGKAKSKSGAKARKP